MSNNNEAVKPGWRSTETWLTFAGTGLLGFVLERLVEILPELAKQPNTPAWLPGLITLALPTIALIMKWNTGKYVESRTQLKLGARANAPTTPSEAARVVGELKPLLAALLIGATLLAPSRALAQDEQTCAELLDAGVPATPRYLLPGTVVTEPTFALSPARMCLVAGELKDCAGGSPPLSVYALLAGGGVVVGAALAVATLAVAGRIK